MEEHPGILDRSFGEATTEEESDNEETTIIVKPVNSLLKSMSKSNHSERPLSFLKLTTDLEGKEIEVLVGPALYASSFIIWLVKFSNKRDLDLIPGDLMNKYFTSHVIRYYQTRILNLREGDVQVDLTKRNTALNLFEDCVIPPS